MLKVLLVAVLTAITYALVRRRNRKDTDASKHNIPLFLGIGAVYSLLVFWFVDDSQFSKMIGGGKEVVGSEYEKHIVQGIRDDCQVGPPPF